jgi:hypothetical protein
MRLAGTQEACGRPPANGYSGRKEGWVLYCHDVARAFADFAGEELSAEIRELIEQHLNQCPGCRAFADDLQTLHHLVRQLQPAPVPPAVLEGLRRAVREDGFEFPGAPDVE